MAKIVLPPPKRWPGAVERSDDYSMGIDSPAKIIGTRIDPETGKPVECPESDHFYRCAYCGGLVDKRDLAQVLAHEDVVNHPSGEGMQ